MKTFISMLLTAMCLATPALAFTYPVSGRWGQSSETKPGPIDCAGKHVIRFDSDRRFDNRGGVPDFRVIDLIQNGANNFRVTEEFLTGQVRAQIIIRLRLIDSDRIELVMSPGGTLKLKRCG
jgi:hypothetical protein